MNQKTTTFGILAILLVGLLTVGLVSAYRGDPSVQGPNYNEDKHTAMEAAFDNLDYDAWYALMTENNMHPRVVDVVTKDNFATFVQAHEAAENGDFETAATLRAQLGLNNGNGPKDGTGQRAGQGIGKSQGIGQGKGMARGTGQGMRQGQGVGQRNLENCPYN